MKTFKYIALVGLLAVFSCQKEDIKPNRSGNCYNYFDNQPKNQPQSGMFIQSDLGNQKIANGKIFSTLDDKGGTTNSENSSSDAGSISGGGGVNNSGGEGSGSGGGITDPNNEPDVSKRKGKK